MSSSTFLKDPCLSFELMCLNAEAKKREGSIISTLDLQESCRNLICYGIDERLLQEELLPFLEKNRQCQLFLLEEDIPHLMYMLKSEWGKQYTTHPRITIDTLSRGLATLNEIAHKTLFSPYRWVSIFDPVTPQYKTSCVLKERFDKERTHLEMHMGMYRDFGADMAKSLLMHIRDMAKGKENDFKWGPSLKDAFREKTVVVCGAGPSLKRALPWLKSIEDKVVLLAAGSAINMMIKEGIQPHLAAVIDPSPPRSRYEKGERAQAIPLFYQFQTDPHAIKDFSKERLLWGTSELFPFESLLMKELGLPQEAMSVGFHAGNFAMHIAANLGFQQVVLVGLEGCALDDKQYGFDVEKESVEPMVCEGLDFKGDPVLTKPEFLKGVEVTESIIKAYPNTRFMVFDDRGLYIEGTSILSETKEEVLSSNSYISPEETQKIIEQADNLKSDSEKRRGVIESIETSLHDCFSWNKSMLDRCKEHIEERGGEMASCYQESLLVTEPFFDDVVMPLWQVFRPMFMAQSEKEDGVTESLLEKIQKGLFTEKVIKAYLEVFRDDKAL